MTIADVSQALGRHAGSLPPLAALFAAEPDRLDRLALDVCGIRFDFSKSAVDAEALRLMGTLAAEADFAGWREKLFAGAIVNPSEGRAATHAAERGSGTGPALAVAAAGQAALRGL
ncbi:hypothetical protein IP88_07120, partial [alpha proteobacterium AAP81b]